MKIEDITSVCIYQLQDKRPTSDDPRSSGQEVPATKGVIHFLLVSTSKINILLCPPALAPTPRREMRELRARSILLTPRGMNHSRRRDHKQTTTELGP